MTREDGTVPEAVCGPINKLLSNFSRTNRKAEREGEGGGEREGLCSLSFPSSPPRIKRLQSANFVAAGSLTHISFQGYELLA